MAEIRSLQDVYQWNITRLADAFGLHRDTVRKRLREAGVAPAKIQAGKNLYALKDAGPALFAETFQTGDSPDDLAPTDRKAWFQSENERVKLEKDLRLLVPVEETHREMSLLAKAVANSLDSLSDMLEREAGLPPEAIERVEQVTDNLREQMYQLIIADDGDDDE